MDTYTHTCMHMQITYLNDFSSAMNFTNPSSSGGRHFIYKDI